MNSIEQLKAEVEQLQSDVSQIKKNTAELLEAWTDAKGALKALAWIGNVARWVTAVSGTSMLIYYFFKGH